MNGRSYAAGVVTLLVIACGSGGEPSVRAAADRDAAASRTEPAAAVLARETQRIDARVAGIDSVFQPLPLLRAAQENALRRYDNAAQLARARELGVGRGLTGERLDELVRGGGLVPLEDTEHWVIRDMDHARPLAVPGVHRLLTEIGERFHARLAEVGAPPYRLEVTSVLRSAQDQAALRRTNPNAAAGESTHEHGTTVDVLYSAFAAPAQPIVEIDAGEEEWLEPHLHRHAVVAAERVAGRRSLELKAILGRVLLEMQEEGRVMVTLERLQPVYHMTVAR